ncbi:MAG: GreA/GreB family elongation factor [Bacteroidales bacterium]
MDRNIRITKLDYIRLSKLITSARKEMTAELKSLNILEYELIRADKVISEKIDPEYITMNSVVQIYNHDIEKLMTIKIVYPEDADFKKNYNSVLSPLGGALIGYKENDTLRFEVPKGEIRITIQKIEYQPESEGNYLV